MANIGQQLAMKQPGVTATELYIATGVTNLLDILISGIKITNFSDEEVIVDVYHDKAGGSTFDNTTVIYSQIRMLPLSNRELPGFWMNTTTEQLGMKADVADKVNIIVYGQIRTS